MNVVRWARIIESNGLEFPTKNKHGCVSRAVYQANALGGKVAERPCYTPLSTDFLNAFRPHLFGVKIIEIEADASVAIVTTIFLPPLLISLSSPSPNPDVLLSMIVISFRIPSYYHRARLQYLTTIISSIDDISPTTLPLRIGFIPSSKSGATSINTSSFVAVVKLLFSFQT